MVQNIDAAVFQRMMIHAHAAINAQKQPINDLNVFPVGDGEDVQIVDAKNIRLQKERRLT